MNKNANSADVRHLTRAIAKAQRKRCSLLKSLSTGVCFRLVGRGSFKRQMFSSSPQKKLPQIEIMA